MRRHLAVLIAFASVAACADDVPESPAEPVAAAAADAARPTEALAAEPPAAHRPRARADDAVKPEPASPAAPKTTAEWIAVLRSEEATDDERTAAVDALVKLGAAAVPFLIDALDDETANPWALRAIGRLGPLALPAASALLERVRQGDGMRNEVPVLWTMGPGAIPLLAKAVKDDAATLRSGATNVLTLLAHTAGKNGDTENARVIADILAGLLKDPDPGVRGMAMAGLTYVWNARADTTSLLLEQLTDESILARRSAAMFLVRCPGDASAVTAALVRALDDPDPWVGFSAATSIRQLGDRAGTARLKLLEFAKKHPEWSGHVTDVGVETLRVALESEDPAVRRIAATQLAGMGTAAAPASAALLAAVDDVDPAVRESALDALAAAGPTAAATPKVRAAFRAEEANVRAAAAGALGRTPGLPDDVVAELIGGLSDPSADVRRECAIALGRIARSPVISVKALVVALDDADLVVRAAAATAIGAFGPSASSAAIDLRRALAHADPWNRLGAAGSLVRIDPPAPDAFAVLAKLAVESNRDVRWRTVILLGNLGSKDGVTILVDRVNDRDAEVRKAAATSLGQLGADGVKALEEMAKSPDDDVAAAANLALARIAGR